VAAIAAQVVDQSHRSSQVVVAGSAGTPAEWVSTWRRVVPCLPCAPYSGHRSTIGAS
jgi:hypothetical protein